MRRGLLGSEGAELAQARSTQRRSARSSWAAPRDKVMQLKNDYDREVWNGDFGECASTLYRVVDMGASGRYELEAARARPLVRMHGAQGTGQRVSRGGIVLHGSHHVLLSRLLRLPAPTRAGWP
jgi:hypothetical protein